MRKVLFLLLFVPGVLLAQSVQESPRQGNTGVSGRWIVNTDIFGSTIYYQMELKQEGEKLSGDFGGDKLEGTLKGDSIYFLAKDEEGGTDEVKGTVRSGAITDGRVYPVRRFHPSGGLQIYGRTRSGTAPGPGATARIHPHYFLPAIFCRQQAGADDCSRRQRSHDDGGCRRGR